MSDGNDKKIDLDDYLKAEFGIGQDEPESERKFMMRYTLTARDNGHGGTVNNVSVELDRSLDEQEAVNSLWLGLTGSYFGFAIQKSGFSSREEFLAFAMTRIGLLTDTIATIADGFGERDGDGEE